MGWFSDDRKVHKTMGRVVEREKHGSMTVVETSSGDIAEVSPSDLAGSDAEWADRWNTGGWGG